MNLDLTDEGLEFLENLPYNVKADIHEVLNNTIDLNEFWLRFAKGFGFESRQELVDFVVTEVEEKKTEDELEEELSVGEIMVLIAILLVNKEIEQLELDE